MVKLRQIREERNRSRYWVAKKSGLGYKTLEAIEKGGDVKLSTLKRLSKILDVGVKDLIEED